MLDQSVVFDRAATFYDETRGFPPGEDRKVGEFLVQAAGLTAASRMIEIGVGTGRIALPVGTHVRRLVGVDLSIPMMERLRAKQQTDYAESRVGLVQGDVMQLPLASGSFDAALIVHILHLVPEPARAVAELARVLRPGGLALQGWNERNEGNFQPLTDAWRDATHAGSDRGDRWHITGNLFVDHGWQEVGSEQVFHFTMTQSAAEMADRYRRRVWSRLWMMPDDEWRQGVAAVEAALKQHYPDPHAPLDIPGSFRVRLFANPA